MLFNSYKFKLININIYFFLIIYLLKDIIPYFINNKLSEQ